MKDGGAAVAEGASGVSDAHAAGVRLGVFARRFLPVYFRLAVVCDLIAMIVAAVLGKPVWFAVAVVLFAIDAVTAFLLTRRKGTR